MRISHKVAIELGQSEGVPNNGLVESEEGTSNGGINSTKLEVLACPLVGVHAGTYCRVHDRSILRLMSMSKDSGLFDRRIKKGL